MIKSEIKGELKNLYQCWTPCTFRVISLSEAIILLILYFTYMKIKKKIGFHFFFVQNLKWQPNQIDS